MYRAESLSFTSTVRVKGKFTVAFLDSETCTDKDLIGKAAWLGVTAGLEAVREPE